jgi:hypothetical protein
VRRPALGQRQKIKKTRIRRANLATVSADREQDSTQAAQQQARSRLGDRMQIHEVANGRGAIADVVHPAGHCLAQIVVQNESIGTEQQQASVAFDEERSTRITSTEMGVVLDLFRVSVPVVLHDQGVVIGTVKHHFLPVAQNSIATDRLITPCDIVLGRPAEHVRVDILK